MHRLYSNIFVIFDILWLFSGTSNYLFCLASRVEWERWAPCTAPISVIYYLSDVPLEIVTVEHFFGLTLLLRLS